MESDEEIGLNLELLSEQERNIIVKVLERDDVQQKVKDSKVGELKVEIQNIRQKTIMHGHDDLSKMCVRCRSELGRLFNRGSLCSQCHFRVCLLCQEKLFNGSILCILCYKLRQLKWLTGEWGAGGHGPLRRWLSGTDLVKSTLSLPQTVLSSTTRTQDDSDIPDNTRLSRQLERNGSARPIVNNDDDKVHYPQDSDKKKLTELFDSFFTKNPESATREKHSRSVKYISTRVFEDSDSSSTASDADITIAHIPSAQSFTVVLKDDDIPLAHSFPSAHSLPADSSSTPVNGEKFVDGTVDIATGEKKKVHAPKLSFSEASHSSFDASKDSSLFSAENSFIKNQSNMNNSIEDSVFKQSESKSESPQFGPSPSRAQRRLTATETIMAMKMAKQLSSTPVQSNSASASSVHDGRTESPIECTMGSLPSSHASSPVSVRNAHLSSLEFKTRQESTDSDSLLKISQDAEFCGADSLPREGPEFVVEEISKIRFQRMSRRAAQCSIPSSAHKSREHSSPEPQQYCDSDIDCAVSDAFSALDQHTHTPITGASGKLLLDHEKNIDQQVVQKDSVEEWKIIEIPVTELSEVDSSHAVLKPKSYNNLCVGQKNEMTSDPIRELFVSDKQSFSNITSSEISEMTSQDCDLSLILPVNTSSMDPHMLTFLGTDLVWDEDQQNICTKQEFENRQCMHPDSMMTDSVFAENICYEDLWPSDNDSSDGFLSNISFPKSETKISSKKLSPWHFKEDNLENDTDTFFGETDFVNKSKSTRVKGQLVPMTHISSDSSNIPSAIIEESVPIDEEFKIKQDKCSGTKVATRLHTLKRTVVDPVKEDNLFDNNTSKIPRVERIIGSEKNNYSTLETVIEDLGRHNDESKSDIFLNENRNGKRSVQSKLETNFSNDISPIAPEKTKQGNISQDKHLPNILSENSQREILTLVDGDSSDVVGTRLVPSVTVPVTRHKSRDDASVHLTRVSEDTELQPVIKVGHYKKFRDRMLKPSVGKLPASKSTESLEFVKTITAMKIDEETMEEENDNFIDEKTIHRMTEPIKNTINIESQPIKYGLTEKTVEIGVTESQVMKNVTVKLAGSGEMVSQPMKIGLTEETVEIGETMAKSPNTGTDNVMHSMKGTPYQGGREQEGHMPNSNVQVLALARQYDLQTSTGIDEELNDLCLFTPDGVTTNVLTMSVGGNANIINDPDCASANMFTVSVGTDANISNNSDANILTISDSGVQQISKKIQHEECARPSIEYCNTVSRKPHFTCEDTNLISRKEIKKEDGAMMTNTWDIVAAPARFDTTMVQRDLISCNQHEGKMLSDYTSIANEDGSKSQAQTKCGSNLYDHPSQDEAMVWSNGRHPVSEEHNKCELVSKNIQANICDQLYCLTGQHGHLYVGTLDNTEVNNKPASAEVKSEIACVKDTQDKNVYACELKQEDVYACELKQEGVITEEVIESELLLKNWKENLEVRFPDFHLEHTPTKEVIWDDRLEQKSMAQFPASFPRVGNEPILNEIEEIVEPGIISKRYSDDLAVRFPHFHTGHYKDDNIEQDSSVQLQASSVSNEGFSKKEVKGPEFRTSESITEEIVEPGIISKRYSDDLAVRFPHFHANHYEEQKTMTDEIVPMSHDHYFTESLQPQIATCKTKQVGKEVLEPPIVSTVHQKKLSVQFPDFHPTQTKVETTFREDASHSASAKKVENTIQSGFVPVLFDQISARFAQFTSVHVEYDSEDNSDDMASQGEIDTLLLTRDCPTKLEPEKIVREEVIVQYSKQKEDLQIRLPHFHLVHPEEELVQDNDNIEQTFVAHSQASSLNEDNGSSEVKFVNPAVIKPDSIEEIVEPGIISKRHSDDLAVRFPHFHTGHYKDVNIEQDSSVQLQACSVSNGESCKKEVKDPECLTSETNKEEIVEPGNISKRHSDDLAVRFPHFHANRYEEQKTMTDEIVPISHDHYYTESSQPRVAICKTKQVGEEVLEPPIVSTVHQKKLSVQFPDFHPTQTKVETTAIAKTFQKDASHSASVKKMENTVQSGFVPTLFDDQISARFAQFTSVHVEYDSEVDSDDMASQGEIDTLLLTRDCPTKLEPEKFVREEVIVPYSKQKEDLRIRLPHFHLVHPKEELIQDNDSIEKTFVTHSQASSQNVNGSNEVKFVAPVVIKLDSIEEIVEPGIISKRHSDDLAVRFPHFHTGHYKDDNIEQDSLVQLQASSVSNGGSSKKEVIDPECRTSETIKEEIVEPGIISKRHSDYLAVRFPHFHTVHYKDDNIEQDCLVQLQASSVSNGESCKKEVIDPESLTSETNKEEIVEPGIISKRHSDDLAVRFPHFHANRYEEQKTMTDEIVPISHDHYYTESLQPLVVVCKTKQVGEEVLEPPIVSTVHQKKLSVQFPDFHPTQTKVATTAVAKTFREDASHSASAKKVENTIQSGFVPVLFDDRISARFAQFTSVHVEYDSEVDSDDMASQGEIDTLLLTRDCPTKLEPEKIVREEVIVQYSKQKEDLRIRLPHCHLVHPKEELIQDNDSIEKTFVTHSQASSQNVNGSNEVKFVVPAVIKPDSIEEIVEPGIISKRHSDDLAVRFPHFHTGHYKDDNIEQGSSVQLQASSVSNGGSSKKEVIDPESLTSETNKEEIVEPGIISKRHSDYLAVRFPHFHANRYEEQKTMTDEIVPISHDHYYTESLQPRVAICKTKQVGEEVLEPPIVSTVHQKILSVQFPDFHPTQTKVETTAIAKTFQKDASHSASVKKMENTVQSGFVPTLFDDQISARFAQFTSVHVEYDSEVDSDDMASQGEIDTLLLTRDCPTKLEPEKFVREEVIVPYSKQKEDLRIRLPHFHLVHLKEELIQDNDSIEKTFVTHSQASSQNVNGSNEVKFVAPAVIKLDSIEEIVEPGIISKRHSDDLAVRFPHFHTGHYKDDNIEQDCLVQLQASSVSNGESCKKEVIDPESLTSETNKEEIVEPGIISKRHSDNLAVRFPHFHANRYEEQKTMTDEIVPISHDHYYTESLQPRVAICKTKQVGEEVLEPPIVSTVHQKKLSVQFPDFHPTQTKVETTAIAKTFQKDASHSASVKKMENTVQSGFVPTLFDDRISARFAQFTSVHVEYDSEVDSDDMASQGEIDTLLLTRDCPTKLDPEKIVREEVIVPYSKQKEDLRIRLPHFHLVHPKEELIQDNDSIEKTFVTHSQASSQNVNGSNEVKFVAPAVIKLDSIEEIVEPGIISKRHSDDLAVRFPHFHTGHYKDDNIEQDCLVQLQASSVSNEGSSKKEVIDPECRTSETNKEEIVEPGIISKRHSDDLAVRFPHFHANRYEEQKTMTDEIVPISHDHYYTESSQPRVAICKTKQVGEEVLEPPIVSTVHQKKLSVQFPDFHPTQTKVETTAIAKTFQKDASHSASVKKMENTVQSGFVPTLFDDQISARFAQFTSVHVEYDSEVDSDDMASQGEIDTLLLTRDCPTKLEPEKIVREEVIVPYSKQKEDLRIRLPHFHLVHPKEELIQDNDSIEKTFVTNSQASSQNVNGSNEVKFVAPAVIKLDSIEEIVEPGIISKRHSDDLAVRFPHFHTGHYKDDNIEQGSSVQLQASSVSNGGSSKKEVIDPECRTSETIKEEIVEPGIISKRHSDDLAVRFPNFQAGHYKNENFFWDDNIEQESIVQLQASSFCNDGSRKKEVIDPEFQISQPITEEIVEPGIISKRHSDDLAVRFPHFHTGHYKDDNIEQGSSVQLQASSVSNGGSSKKEVKGPEFRTSETIKEEIVEPGIISKRHSDDLAVRFPHFHANRYEEQKTMTDEIVPMSHDHCYAESLQPLVVVCKTQQVDEVLEPPIVPISHQEQTIERFLFSKIFNSSINTSIDSMSFNISSTVTYEVVKPAGKKSCSKIRKCRTLSFEEEIIEPGIVDEKYSEQHSIQLLEPSSLTNSEQADRTPSPIEERSLFISTSKVQEMVYESEPMKPPSPKKRIVKNIMIDEEIVEHGELPEQYTDTFTHSFLTGSLQSYLSAHDLEREKADGTSDNEVSVKDGCSESFQRACSVCDDGSLSNSIAYSRSPRKSLDDVWEDMAKKMSTTYSLVKNEVPELGSESKSLVSRESREESLATTESAIHFLALRESEDKFDQKALKQSLAPLDTPELKTIDRTPVNDPDISEMNFLMTRSMPNNSSPAVSKHSQSDNKDLDTTLVENPETKSVPGKLSPTHITVASNLGIYHYQTTHTDVQPEKVPVVKLSDESTSLEDSGLVSEASHDTTSEHRRTDSSNSQSSIPSLTFSVRTDHSHEDDDIDSIVASHRSLYSSLGGSHGNLLTTIADSRESIMSFYSNAGDVDYGKIPITGDILFGLDYNYRTGSLEVMINKCQNIAPVDTKHKRSDPYVKTYLLPDKTHSGKRKTKIKKHTLNPTFDEVLRYVISNSELESRTLWVSVWHSDRFGRNDFLGEVTINFDYYKFGDSTPKWYPLHERMDTQHHSVLAYKGDIILSIRYVTSDKLVHDASSSPMPSRKKAKKSKPAYSQGELQVLIKEARNLTAVRSNGYSDPFCKGFLLPETKHKSCKQKTPVMKKDCNPVWNYTLMFDDVSLEELQERCLELSIWDQDRLLGNDFLGGLRLNLGLGLSSGKHVDWMDAKGEEISVWQSMLEHPNTWIDGALILRPSMNKRHH